MTEPAPARPAGLASLAGRYDVLLCDVWGIVHDGRAALRPAGEALTRYRAGGGRVALVSNSPRPGDAVVAQMDGLGVVRSAYDLIVTSGDVTRALIRERAGQRAYHLGPARDLAVFEGDPVSRVPLEEADFVVNTGLFDDDTETPEDYRALIAAIGARGLTMICANPDVVVEKGERLVYCAGALADLYMRAGGAVIWAGKPHPLIYERALAEIARRFGAAPARARMLAIGDSLRTDVTGALRLGVESLFVTRGIHAGEAGDGSPQTLRRVFAEWGVTPTYVMPTLAW